MLKKRIGESREISYLSLKQTVLVFVYFYHHSKRHLEFSAEHLSEEILSRQHATFCPAHRLIAAEAADFRKSSWMAEDRHIRPFAYCLGYSIGGNCHRDLSLAFRCALGSLRCGNQRARLDFHADVILIPSSCLYHRFFEFLDFSHPFQFS